MLFVFVKIAAVILFKAIIFGALYFLRRHFDKVVADMSGWTFVKPGFMYWFVSVMCAAWALLMIYVLSSDNDCACDTAAQDRDDYYAVVGMLVCALVGLSLFVWHMAKVYRQRLGFNGNMVTYADVNSVQRIVPFIEITDVIFKWGHLEGVTLSNNRRLYLNEYTRGGAEFLSALVEHNRQIRDQFGIDDADRVDPDSIRPV